MSKRLAAATIAKLFLKAGEHWGDQPAFATRTNKANVFQNVSYTCWSSRAKNLATALIDLGVKARDHIGLISDNRFEWILASTAIQYCGAADVPRARDMTADEMLYILCHADVEVVFVENQAVLEKLDSVRAKLPLLKKVILMDITSQDTSEDVFCLQALEEHGRRLRHEGDRRAEERCARIVPEDLSTIIYTSGTTGIPKGVPITHQALCSQIDNLIFSLSKEERALSILPIWHSYERIFEILVISYGATLYYSSIRYLKNDLMIVKPTVMASAPRLWEALYERMMAHVSNQDVMKRCLFSLARGSAHWVRHAWRFFLGQQLDVTGRSWRESLRLALGHGVRLGLACVPFVILDRLILARLRMVVGGCFRATISGGGALSPHIDSFFYDMGIQIFEGYGLTESSPVLAVRTEENFVLGSVGPPLPKTEIKIHDLVSGEILYPNTKRTDLGRGLSGEIYARGPQIMKGYHKDPQTSSLILKEGWLKTGDIGMITFNNCLKIIGRCKETIVLKSGENVEPLPIESRLLESPLIEQCMVVGQDQKHLGVLLVPSLNGFLKLGWSITSLEELIYEEALRPVLHREVQRLISPKHGFKRFERIGCEALLSQPFQLGEELTATYKLKRHVIFQKYHDLITQMYET